MGMGVTFTTLRGIYLLKATAIAGLSMLGVTNLLIHGEKLVTYGIIVYVGGVLGLNAAILTHKTFEQDD